MKSSSFSHFFPKQRRGMEIAINTLVVMILGILIVGGGIVLVAKISGGGIDVAEQVSKDQESRIMKLLDSGQLVAVYPSDQKAPIGKTSTYGIGIFNSLPRETEFTITHHGDDLDGLTINYLPTITVKSNERGMEIITVKPSKTVPKGTYTVIVDVTHKDENGADVKYDTRFFTVTV